MRNQNVSDAWAYHNNTKHSPESVRRNVHFMDWANQPLLFKIYPDVEPIPLPRDTQQTGVAALSAIATPAVPDRDVTPDLRAITSLLYFSAGVTRRRGEILFRAAACTGALYEVELYLACGALQDLDAGLYHFNPGDLSLRRLRAGDYRGVVAAAAGHDEAIERAPAIVIATGTYFRNGWKYQARTYRHFGWDNGTLTANSLAVAAARKLPARIVSGFVDGEVNRLLGLDTRREVALHLVPVGRSGEAAPEYRREVAPLELETLPYSHHEVDYPEMLAVHEASSLERAEEVAAWRDAAAPPLPLPEPTGRVVALEPLADERLPGDDIETVIL